MLLRGSGRLDRGPTVILHTCHHVITEPIHAIADLLSRHFVDLWHSIELDPYYISSKVIVMLYPQ